PLNRAPIALIIDEQRWGNFIPIPGLVGRILEISLDRAGRHVEGDGRGSVQIVARAFMAQPWTAVAGAPIGGVCIRIVVSGDPNRSAAVLPFAVLRPRLAARFTRRGNGISAPEFLSGF